MNWIQLQEKLPFFVSFNSYKIGLFWKQDYRNLHYYSTEGFYRYILVENFAYSKLLIDKIILDYRQYHTFNNKINLSAALNLKYINPLLPFYYLSNDWNITQIRGIYLKVLPYQALANIKTYVRYNIIEKKVLYIKALKKEEFAKTFYFAYIGLFFDAAYTYYQDEYDFYYSMGLSFDFATYYDKVLRLEIAYNNLDKNIGVFLNLKAPF